MLTPPELAKKDLTELNRIYKASEAGPIPDGDSRGTAIFFPDTTLTRPLGLLASGIWKGKIFHTTDSTLRNKVLGLRLFKAKVYKGESWLDGRPSVIIDYKETSLAVGFIRDEIRHVAPGLYLGIAYLRTKPKPTFGLYFVLDFNTQGP